MMRIYIVGTTGSGKTTLATKIAEKLNIPLIDLDELHFKPIRTGIIY
ncbi:MAG: AAA family ATPase [Chitinophagales bacterium]|nr:AAA family ATPase [Chitinophagales bacterium]